MLKKYFAIYRYMFIRTLQFRTELVIYIILDMLPFFVLFFIWQAVFSDQETINSLTLPEVTQYYVLVMFIERFISTHFESWRAREVREGKIDYFLTRPFSFINEIFSKDVGGKLVSLAISLPSFLLFFLLIRVVMPVAPLSLTPTLIFFFILFMIAAYLMQFMIALWIVLLTFWFEGSAGFEHFKWITITLFSGAMLPVAFMPEWLETVYTALPFKFMYAVPIMYVQGTMHLSFSLVAHLATSLLVMAAFTQFLWSRAVYKYSSAGG